MVDGIFSLKRIFLGRKTFESLKQYKYIGVIIDCQLSFQHHVSCIEKRLVKFYGLLYRLRKVSSNGTSHKMIQNFLTYIMPILQYGLLVYGSTSKNVLKNLKKLTKRFKLFFTNGVSNRWAH